MSDDNRSGDVGQSVGEGLGTAVEAYVEGRRNGLSRGAAAFWAAVFGVGAVFHALSVNAPPDLPPIASIGSSQVPTIVPQFSVGRGSSSIRNPRYTYLKIDRTIVDEAALGAITKMQALTFLNQVRGIPKIVPGYQWCSYDSAAVHIPGEGWVKYEDAQSIRAEVYHQFGNEDASVELAVDRGLGYYDGDKKTCLVTIFKKNNLNNEQLLVAIVQSLLRLGLPEGRGIVLCSDRYSCAPRAY